MRVCVHGLHVRVLHRETVLDQALVQNLTGFKLTGFRTCCDLRADRCPYRLFKETGCTKEREQV